MILIIFGLNLMLNFNVKMIEFHRQVVIGAYHC